VPIAGIDLSEPAPPLYDLLRRGLDEKPEEVAVVSAEEAVTWRELDERASAVAAGYRELGLEPGDRIASLMPNRVALLIHYLGAFRAGLVVTPLNYRYTWREIDHALEVSGARAIVAHVERHEDLGASKLVAGLDLGRISYGGGAGEGVPRLEDLITGEVPAEPFPPVDDEAPAAIFFTSGSTGPSKGVTHSHSTLRWMLASAEAAFELT
jgi:acyl-CoA synthetase (AMP-forming)/AMP-acid ligase II